MLPVSFDHSSPVLRTPAMIVSNLYLNLIYESHLSLVVSRVMKEGIASLPTLRRDLRERPLVQDHMRSNGSPLYEKNELGSLFRKVKGIHGHLVNQILFLMVRSNRAGIVLRMAKFLL